MAKGRRKAEAGADVVAISVQEAPGAAPAMSIHCPAPGSSTASSSPRPLSDTRRRQAAPPPGLGAPSCASSSWQPRIRLGPAAPPPGSAAPSPSASPRPAAAEVDEGEERAIAERQGAFAERLRLHLTSHLGGAAAASQALDVSDDGTASVDELAGRFAALSIPQADEEGQFDLRRAIFIFESSSPGRLDLRDLLYSQPHEVAERVLARRRRIAEGEEAGAPKAPRSDEAGNFMVERLRRLLRSNFPSLQEAFKALDQDKDGELDFGDLVAGLNEKRVDATDALGKIDLEVAYQSMDIDGSNALTVQELLGKWPVRRARKGMPVATERRAPNASERLVLKEVFLQVGLVERFRAHLQSHFGGAQQCMEALDANEDGDISFDELLQGCDAHAVKECDATGRYFDLRRIFYVLDTDGSGALSMDELMLRSRDELIEKIISRPNLTQKAPQPSKDYVPINTLERFRRLCERIWGDLSMAYKALDINANGDLSLGEILAGFDRKLVNLLDERGTIDAKIAYKSLDMDQQGGVTIAEVRGVWPMSRRLAKATLEVWQKMGQSVAADRSRRRGGYRDMVVRWGRRKADFSLPVETAPPGKSLSMKKIEAFGAEASMDELDLRHACVGMMGVERLADAFRSVRVRQVQVIDLQGNYIGDAGVLKLIPAIEEHCLLTKFVLNLNGICDVGAERLSRYILKAASLVELHLADNHIGSPGAKDFFKALTGKKAKPLLRVVNLERNAITDSGVAALRSVPEKTQALPKKGFKLLLAGNPGDYPKPVAVNLGCWGGDIAYKPIARPFLLKPLPGRVEALGASPLSAARPGSSGRVDGKSAAAASAEGFGNIWYPSVKLHASLDIARVLGEGDWLTVQRLGGAGKRTASLSSLSGGRPRRLSRAGSGISGTSAWPVDDI